MGWPEIPWGRIKGGVLGRSPNFLRGAVAESEKAARVQTGTLRGMQPPGMITDQSGISRMSLG